MNLEIRNPSGFCDHLYYPEYCNICEGLMKKRNEEAIRNARKR